MYSRPAFPKIIAVNGPFSHPEFSDSAVSSDTSLFDHNLHGFIEHRSMRREGILQLTCTGQPRCNNLGANQAPFVPIQHTKRNQPSRLGWHFSPSKVPYFPSHSCCSRLRWEFASSPADKGLVGPRHWVRIASRSTLVRWRHRSSLRRRGLSRWLGDRVRCRRLCLWA